VSTLEAGVTHAWCRETNASEHDRCRASLSVEELAWCDRFHLARDRHDYANAHALLRTTLSRYDSMRPDAWRFKTTEHGKPALVSDAPAAAPLTFNLSHTRGIVACVVSSGATVGIDIERADRVRDSVRIAARFFSTREVAGVRRCAGDNDRTRRFVELWTLKEAFIKATGKGLSQPLDSFTFDLDEDHAIRFTPPPGGGSAAWQFSQYEVMPGVVAAIAVCGAPSCRPVMRMLRREVALELCPYRTTTFEE